MLRRNVKKARNTAVVQQFFVFINFQTINQRKWKILLLGYAVLSVGKSCLVHVLCVDSLGYGIRSFQKRERPNFSSIYFRTRRFFYGLYTRKSDCVVYIQRDTSSFPVESALRA